MENRKEDIVNDRPLCAVCGAVIRPDWIIDDVLCPYCLDRIREAGPSWDSDMGLEKGER